MDPHAKVKYIQNNMEIPDRELAKELDESVYFVWLCKEVTRNENLQSRSCTRQAKIDTREANDKYTVEQAGRVLGTSHATVARLLREGELKGHKIDRTWVIMKEDLQEYQSQQESEKTCTNV